MDDISISELEGLVPSKVIEYLNQQLTFIYESFCRINDKVRKLKPEPKTKSPLDYMVNLMVDILEIKMDMIDIREDIKKIYALINKGGDDAIIHT